MKTEDRRDDNINHTISGTVQGFLAGLISLPTGVVTAGFLSRNLGPENYGLLTVAASIVLTVEVIVTVGFCRTAVKFVSESDDWEKSASAILHTQFIVSLVAAAGLFVAAPFFASMLNAEALTFYLRLFSLDIPFFALSNVHQSILVGRGRYGNRAFLIGGYWIMRMVFVIVLVGAGLSVSGAIIAGISASATVLIGARCLIQSPFLRRQPAFPVARIWNYAIPLFVYIIGISLFKALDLLVVKGLVDSPAVAGYYGAARNLTIVPILFASALSPLVLAKLTEFLRSDEIDAARDLTKSAMRSVVCLLPFAGMTAGAADEIVVAIYGGDFRPAGGLLSLLIFASLGQVMISLVVGVLVALERPNLTAVFTLPLVPLAFVLHWLIVPSYGAVGAAWITTFLTTLSAILLIVAVHRIFQSFPPLWPGLRSVAICIGAYFLASGWSTPGFFVFFKITLISGLILLTYILVEEVKINDLASIKAFGS